MLRKIVSFVGCLVGAPLGSGCWKGSAISDRTFKASFPVTNEQDAKMCGREDLGKVWESIRFADPLRFKKTDETIEAFGYHALTLADFGEAYTGKYAMRATLREGDTGGPPGTATELFVELDDVRLVEKLKLPVAPPGAKAILPGQMVVRKIAEGEFTRLDDRYLIELPAKKVVTVRLNLLLDVNDSEFKVGAAEGSTPLIVEQDGSYHRFETTRSGLHEIQIRPGSASAGEPDIYLFYVTWGDVLGVSGDLGNQRVTFRKIRTSGSKVQPGNEH